MPGTIIDDSESIRSPSPASEIDEIDQPRRKYCSITPASTPPNLSPPRGRDRKVRPLKAHPPRRLSISPDSRANSPGLFPYTSVPPPFPVRARSLSPLSRPIVAPPFGCPPPPPPPQAFGAPYAYGNGGKFIPPQPQPNRRFNNRHNTFIHPAAVPLPCPPVFGQPTVMGGKQEALKPLYASYREYVRENVGMHPEYTGLAKYLERNFPIVPEAAINIVDFSMYDGSFSVASMDEKPKHGVGSRLIVITHAGILDPAIIEKVGYAYDVDPTFWVEHLELETPTPKLSSEVQSSVVHIQGTAGRKVSACFVPDPDDMVVGARPVYLDEVRAETVVMLIKDQNASLLTERRGTAKTSIYRASETYNNSNTINGVKEGTLTHAFLQLVYMMDNLESEDMKYNPSPLMQKISHLLLLEVSATLATYRLWFRSGRDADSKNMPEGWTTKLIHNLDDLEDIARKFSDNDFSLTKPTRFNYRYPQRRSYGVQLCHQRDAQALQGEIGLIRGDVQNFKYETEKRVTTSLLQGINAYPIKKLSGIAAAVLVMTVIGVMFGAELYSIIESVIINMPDVVQLALLAVVGVTVLAFVSPRVYRSVRGGVVVIRDVIRRRFSRRNVHQTWEYESLDVNSNSHSSYTWPNDEKV